MRQTDDIATRADSFIQENEELLEPDTSIHVLEAILVQGSEIGTELAGEYKRAVDIAVPCARKLEDAIRSKKVPPKQVAALDVEYNRAKRDAEALNKELDRFMEFMEKAQSLYHGQVDEDEQAVLEEMGVARPESNVRNMKGKDGIALLWESDEAQYLRADANQQKPKPWWRRVFG